MDQVRAIVRVLWTQRFWVLSVLCLVVGLVCWNIAASNINAEFEARKQKINTAYTNVSGINNEAYHPNDNVNEGDEKQARQQGAYVLEEWKELYDRQRSEVLFWPPSLGDSFNQHMQGRKFGDPISSTMRDRYYNYIESRFDGLLEIVKAKKTAVRGGGRGGERGDFGGREEMGRFSGAFAAGRDGGLEEDDDFLVLWIDQGKVQDKLHFKSTPSDLQVWVTQEDLWVYETLLNVIASTNKARGATRPDNTAVRAIVALEVGSEAAGKPMGQVFIPQDSSGEGGGREGEYGDYGDFGRGTEGGYGEYGRGMEGGYGRGMEGGGEYGRGMEFGGGRGGGGGDGSLLMSRYLDNEGNPVEDGTPESVATGEFRQLPVRLKLMMDQRWIPRILIECANATLPVEVGQVRINPNLSGSGISGRQNSRGSRDRSLQGMAPDPNLADVEIRGIVYIYNEPNLEQLLIPGGDENSGGDENAVAASGL